MTSGLTRRLNIKRQISFTKKWLWAFSSFLLVSAVTYGCKELPPAPVDSTTAYYRVMWNADASTMATVGWSSFFDPEAKDAVEPSEGTLYIDTMDHGQDLNQYAIRLKPDATNLSYGMKNSFVRLTNLKPNTKYYFVVEKDGGISPRHWFETASNRESDRLSIIAGGDSRNNAEVRMKANSLVAKLRAHAVMFGGDYTALGTDTQWQRWLQDWQLSFAADGRITPIIATQGNHEKQSSMLVDLFDTPEGVYYATRINGDLLRVYTLNTEISIGGKQTEWLKADLAANPNPIWKFAQYHRPMRPHTKGKAQGDAQYKYWAGLFFDFGMNLVSESDAHTVKSTWPVRPSNEGGSSDGFIRDDVNGTMYIGEGCWGAPLRDDNRPRAWTRDHGKFNHFNWIFVNRDTVEIRTVKVDNANNVGELNDRSRFDLPSGIELWAPKNGAVVTLTR